MQSDKQPKYLKRRHKAIKKYSDMLSKNEITPMTFLATMANNKNHIVYKDEDISLEEVEVQMASGKELYGGDDDRATCIFRNQ